MGDVDLPVVHELEQGEEVVIFDVSQHDDWVLAGVALKLENGIKFGATKSPHKILEIQRVYRKSRKNADRASVVHLEKVSEVRTAGGEEHLVRGQLPPLHAQGDVHEVLLLQQGLEGGHQVGLVVVPSQAEPLVRGAHSAQGSNYLNLFLGAAAGHELVQEWLGAVIDHTRWWEAGGGGRAGSQNRP